MDDIMLGSIEYGMVPASVERMERLRRNCKLHGLGAPREDLTDQEVGFALNALQKRAERRVHND